MPSIHQRLGEKAERAWEMVVNEQKIRHSGAPVPSRPTGATQRALTCAFFCTKGLSGSAGAIHPRRRFASAKICFGRRRFIAEAGVAADQARPCSRCNGAAPVRQSAAA
jgi:hypothetical protein